MQKHQSKTKDVNISTANKENEVKTIKVKIDWTKEETDFLLKSKMSDAKIAKKLKRSVPSIATRRWNIKQKIAEGKPIFNKRGRPAAAKTIGPATPVLVSQTYSYSGRHQIVTLHKLSWLSQKLLGVKLAA